MDIYFISRVTIQYYIIYFVAQRGSALTKISSFSWSLCPFDILSSLAFFIYLFVCGPSILVGIPKCSHKEKLCHV